MELVELTLTSYKQLYQKKSDFKVQKQLIDSFITRLKNRVNELCDELVENHLKLEENINSQANLKDEMKDLGKVYEEQLMEMLS
jgi:DNA-binding transcriptional regulator GbsR (MarR family)